ncbi:MAG TPA: permease prefix domain 1-containing protein, partial [Candidatus Acidoferrales bacterium]|nr:permease prefix domain 1-containing protein [Candidatus Acidoferrales bacterium]
MLSSLRMLLARMRGMFSRRHEDNEFSDELREHLDLLTEENVRRGMPLTEARREAKIRLGGTAQLRET